MKRYVGRGGVHAFVLDAYLGDHDHAACRCMVLPMSLGAELLDAVVYAQGAVFL